MYHLQLRQFPHNANSFNLDERQLRAVLYPWVAERVVELGERKWHPHQATLIVIEGPHLALESLSLGRGWRAAERNGVDVTERVLAQARQELLEAQAQQAATAPAATAAAMQPVPAVPAAASAAAQTGGREAAGPPSGDALAAGVELAALLGPDALRLLSAWRRIAARAPGLTPSESLALAERELAEHSGDR